MTEIRQPDDWREGDLAFCIEVNSAASLGDIRRVTAVGEGGGTLRFGGRQHASVSKKCFARILTRDEVSIMPTGAVLFFVSTVLLDPILNAGSTFMVTEHWKPAEGHLYALCSLPKPKHEFKVGDWVKHECGAVGKIDQISGRNDNYASTEQLNTALYLPNCVIITEAEAQRLLALKDIEDARKKLAEAEKRLEGLDEA